MEMIELPHSGGRGDNHDDIDHILFQSRLPPSDPPSVAAFWDSFFEATIFFLLKI